MFMIHRRIFFLVLVPGVFLGVDKSEGFVQFAKVLGDLIFEVLISRSVLTNLNIYQIYV